MHSLCMQERHVAAVPQPSPSLEHFYYTFDCFFSVFPSLDHPNHSQPAFTRSKYRSYTPWTCWDGALG